VVGVKNRWWGLKTGGGVQKQVPGAKKKGRRLKWVMGFKNRSQVPKNGWWRIKNKQWVQKQVPGATKTGSGG